MRIAVITAAWKRHELLTFFCEYWQILAHSLKLDGIELMLYCTVSEPEAREICECAGWVIIDAPNDPLHAKHNAAVLRSKDDKPDYCLMIGSDDIMNRTLILNMVERMKEGTDYIAPLDWMFFDTNTKTGQYWKGYREAYRHGEPCGAGRALSARLLKLLGWQPWLPGFDKVLDTGFTRKLKPIEHTRDFFFIGSIPGAAGMDIKTNQNMTPYKPWPNTKPIPNMEQWMEQHFGKYTAFKIMQIDPGPLPPPELKRREPALPQPFRPNKPLNRTRKWNR